MRGVLLLLLTIAHIAGTARADEDAADIAYFEKHIRPALVEHCYECHSVEAARAGKLKGGLQLDTREGIRRGGDSGSAVVPGNAAESMLLDALRYESFEMPPGGRLPDGVIARFEEWVARGAADPRDGETAAKAPALGLDEAGRFWSFQPVRRPPEPKVDDPQWPLGGIDRFVRAALNEQRLTPVGPSDKAKLLRRVSFDLIGLPPTPEELQGFLADGSPPALERIVDRLLASPHFGERWGRHWLDLARFSESCGSTRNMVWRHAWRYRDYVIDAFNRDLPFDRFIREQIAGDLLPAENAAERERQLVATGFLALGPKALDEQKREVFVMDAIDEQIDTISRVFLGLSVACARCHDHKFDPVPTRDYYALAGVFRSTDTLYGYGPRGIRVENGSALQPIGPRAEELAPAAAEHLRQVQEQTQKRSSARSDRYRVVRKVADLKRQLALPAADQESLQSEIDRLESEIKDWDERIKEMEADLQALVENPPPQPDFAMAARDASEMHDCRIHIRGETTKLGDSVPRGLLQVISLDAPLISPDESGRRQLADWLAHRDNPLTAGVMVNRVWQHLFGRGLVTTPDDFGVNGAPPSHPELLDWLAVRFVQQGRSVKRLIREIVLSRTYQLGSEPKAGNQERDPENVWLWRMRPRPLEAEAFRDAVLAASGRLDRQPLKGSVVATLDPFTQPEFNFSLQLSESQMQHGHRSVYLPVVRGNLPELMKLFDFADPNRPVSERSETILPVQSMFLANSPWMIENARRFAHRLLTEIPGDDQRRLDRLYELALSRRPTEAERLRMLAFLGEPQELTSPSDGQSTSVEEAWTSLCHVVLASAESRYVQ